MKQVYKGIPWPKVKKLMAATRKKKLGFKNIEFDIEQIETKRTKYYSKKTYMYAYRETELFNVTLRYEV